MQRIEKLSHGETSILGRAGDGVKLSGIELRDEIAGVVRRFGERTSKWY